MQSSSAATHFVALRRVIKGGPDNLSFTTRKGLLQLPVTERIASRIMSTTTVGAVTLGV